jgi:hypothetical protein
MEDIMKKVTKSLALLGALTTGTSLGANTLEQIITT